MSKLLDERPLIVLPSLAGAVGLNEAIVLQQLHWTLGRHSVHTDENGLRWVQMTLEGWAEMFPFWSDSTIRRVFQVLRDAGLVHTTRGRESNVYAIDYAELSVKLNSPERSDRPVETVQVDQSPCKREGTGERTAGGDDAAGDGHLPGLAPPAAVQPESDAKVEELWAHYSMIFGDRLRVKELTPPRKRALAKALKATADDLDLCKRAMDGLKSYRIANPGGSKDIGLGVIFETGPQSRSNLTDQIEWWAAQAGDQATVPASVPSALRGRVLDLAVTVLKRELQPDSEAVAERAIQAEAQLSERFKLKVASDGAGKLLRFEAVA